ncbi:MAG: hypothetical protein HZC02_02840 [Candidatus Levybacteria bacterium]|nr:hypothetical protein [Candidatus Levybacteria bacterium]
MSIFKGIVALFLALVTCGVGIQQASTHKATINRTPASVMTNGSNLSAKCVIDLVTTGAPYLGVEAMFYSDGSFDEELANGNVPLIDWNACEQTTFRDGKEYRVSDLTLTCGSSTVRIVQELALTTKKNLISGLKIPCSTPGDGSRVTADTKNYSCGRGNLVTITFTVNPTASTARGMHKLGVITPCSTTHISS